MCHRPQVTRAEIILILAAFALATSFVTGTSLAAPPRFLPGSDWPTYRHDAGLSAVSPLKGGLGQPPRIAWSIDLGGPRIPSETVQVRDVTGDGRDEILILGSDTVECRRRDGTTALEARRLSQAFGRRRPRLCRRRRREASC